MTIWRFIFDEVNHTASAKEQGLIIGDGRAFKTGRKADLAAQDRGSNAPDVEKPFEEHFSSVA